jgi:hypothetical protein
MHGARGGAPYGNANCLADELPENNEPIEPITEAIRKKDLGFLRGGYVCDHCGAVKPATTYALPTP